MPTLLRDALRLKRERGDADCEAFKDIANTYAYRLNATIQGAAWTMRQLIRKPLASPTHQAARVAFLADLDAIMGGTFAAEQKRAA